MQNTRKTYGQHMKNESYSVVHRRFPVTEHRVFWCFLVFSRGKTKNSLAFSAILREFSRVYWGSEQLENAGKQRVPQRSPIG